MTASERVNMAPISIFQRIFIPTSNTLTMRYSTPRRQKKLLRLCLTIIQVYIGKDARQTRIPESAPFPLTSGGGNVWTGTVLWTLRIEIGSNSRPKSGRFADGLELMRMKETAEVVREGFAETLTYCGDTAEHWQRICTNNAIEQLNRKIRRRTCMISTFPDESRLSCWWPVV